MGQENKLIKEANAHANKQFVPSDPKLDKFADYKDVPGLLDQYGTFEEKIDFLKPFLNFHMKREQQNDPDDADKWQALQEKLVQRKKDHFQSVDGLMDIPPLHEGVLIPVRPPIDFLEKNKQNILHKMDDVLKAAPKVNTLPERAPTKALPVPDNETLPPPATPAVPKSLPEKSKIPGL